MIAAAPGTLVRHVAIAGNPNCGKSTIFNALTGLRQKTGNYPGVTVEEKIGRFFGSHGEPMDLLDLPGSYSLQVRSPDEAVARDVLLGRRADTPRPDVIICVVDASNLERNLYLVAQLLEVAHPGRGRAEHGRCRRGKRHRHRSCRAARKARRAGDPMVATKGVGFVELTPGAVALAAAAAGNVRADADRASRREAHGAREATAGRVRKSRAREALLLLTLHDDAQIEVAASRPADHRRHARRADSACAPPASIPSPRPSKRATPGFGESARAVAAHRRQHDALSISDKLDAVLTHRVWGWARVPRRHGADVLLHLHGRAVSDGLDRRRHRRARRAGSTRRLPEGDSAQPAHRWRHRWRRRRRHFPAADSHPLFLPRAARRHRLHGARGVHHGPADVAASGCTAKSFIPMLSSLACAIPGIMATRTIENRKDRLVTILVAPLMSCSARLPVYALMIAVLLPPRRALAESGHHADHVSARDRSRRSAWRGCSRRRCSAARRRCCCSRCRRIACRLGEASSLRMWERAAHLPAPRRHGHPRALDRALGACSRFRSRRIRDAGPADAIAHSFGGRMGHAIEPLIAPLGYDWKIGIGLIGSFAAREVFVGTMGIVYNVENADEEHRAAARHHARGATSPMAARSSRRSFASA